MTQIVDAIFEDGMFKPDGSLNLAPQTRVRLTVEPISAIADRAEAWDELNQLLDASTVDSKGHRMSRDELHDRD